MEGGKGKGKGKGDINSRAGFLFGLAARKGREIWVFLVVGLCWVHVCGNRETYGGQCCLRERGRVVARGNRVLDKKFWFVDLRLVLCHVLGWKGEFHGSCGLLFPVPAVESLTCRSRKASRR